MKQIKTGGTLEDADGSWQLRIRVDNPTGQNNPCTLIKRVRHDTHVGGLIRAIGRVKLPSTVNLDLKFNQNAALLISFDPVQLNHFVVKKILPFPASTASLSMSCGGPSRNGGCWSIIGGWRNIQFKLMRDLCLRIETKCSKLNFQITNVSKWWSISAPMCWAWYGTSVTFARFETTLNCHWSKRTNLTGPTWALVRQ